MSQKLIWGANTSFPFSHHVGDVYDGVYSGDILALTYLFYMDLLVNDRVQNQSWLWTSQ